MHIAVSGNIGSGKTTLTNKLALHYGWKAEFEDVESNPYLLDFYKDMKRWAFHVQVSFLNIRFLQVQNIRDSKLTTIQDRTIYEDAYIFAANLHKSGLIEDRDYDTYLGLFHSMVKMVQAPDLLIYLKADIPKLIAQISQRGREYENAIRIDYLQNLNEHYNAWIQRYNKGKLLVIDVNDLDFVSRSEDFSFIVEKIDRELHGLFG